MRYQDIEAIERDGHKTIKADQVDQFRSPVLSKLLDRLWVVQLGKGAVPKQRRSNVVGYASSLVRSAGRWPARMVASFSLCRPLRSAAMTWA